MSRTQQYLENMIQERLLFEPMTNYVTQHFLGQLPMSIPGQKVHSRQLLLES